MTSGISNNYSLANMAGSLTTKAMSSTSGTTGNTGMNASNIGSTFLSLLTQELQNQDPTAPMDSTAMVGQMISLNSLSQLVSINQTLSNATGASTSTQAKVATQPDQQQSQAVAPAAKDAAVAAIQAAAASTNPLSYLFPMNQLSGQGTSAANVSAAQSALLSSPSAIR